MRELGWIVWGGLTVSACSSQPQPTQARREPPSAEKSVHSLLELGSAVDAETVSRFPVERGVPLDQWEKLPDTFTGWPDTQPDFEPLSCDEAGLPWLDELTTTRPYDTLVILEKLEGLLRASVVAERGQVLCGEADAAPDCLAEVTSGVGLGDGPGGDRRAMLAPLRLDPWGDKYRLHLVLRRAGRSERVVSREAIRELLGPVKSGAHAAWLAAIEGLRFECDALGSASTRKTSEGFEVVGIPQSLDDMPPCSERLRVLVREDSSMAVVARRRLVRRGGRCVL
jgi:hypothetical protein